MITKHDQLQRCRTLLFMLMPQRFFMPRRGSTLTFLSITILLIQFQVLNRRWETI